MGSIIYMRKFGFLVHDGLCIVSITVTLNLLINLSGRNHCNKYVLLIPNENYGYLYADQWQKKTKTSIP